MQTSGIAVCSMLRSKAASRGRQIVQQQEHKKPQWGWRKPCSGRQQMPCKLGLAATLSSKRRGTAKAFSEAVADA